MARIRSVKPELRRDLTVAEWPRERRYAWVLLWGYLDDCGRGLDDLRLLVADLFPLDRDVTERKLDTWLDQMTADTVHGRAPLCRYEVDGRRYLHAPKWGKSQRVSHPQDSTIPSCPIHERSPSDSGTDPEPIRNEDGADPESFRTSRDARGLGLGAREQGSKVVAPPGAVPEPEPAKPPRAAAKGTRIPDTWPLDDIHREGLRLWAAEHTPAVKLRSETENWQDWHRAKGDTAKDWTASWRTWMRRAQKDRESRPAGRPVGRVAEGDAILAEAFTRGQAERRGLSA